MSGTTVVWGSPSWAVPALVLLAAGMGLLWWRFRREGGGGNPGRFASGLKILCLTLLALSLLEPLFSETRPQTGANLFLVLGDESRSLQVRDRGESESRGERLTRLLDEEAPWFVRLSQDFDVRKYLFGDRVRGVEDFEALDFNAQRSRLGSALTALESRFRGRPLAGVLLFTDGNATDRTEGSVPLEPGCPPIYPVILGKEGPSRDLSLVPAIVSQSNFEQSPVTIRTEVRGFGFEGERVVVELEDEAGKVVQEEVLLAPGDGETSAVRFQLRPETGGVHFYRIGVRAESERTESRGDEDSDEATLVNNEQLVVVDRGRGPYRILYVSGRPNWEFKFLRRSLEEDDEIELVGLIRIAKREPKFDFIGHEGESTNPLFRGFSNVDDEEAERYDQPVLMRVGTKSEEELRGGFPTSEADLFGYDALVFDDVEAGFLTRDQQALVQSFVSRRGGGFLMLGGQESFSNGDYRRTPIADLLPVYLDRGFSSPRRGEVRLALSREGWLRSWMRLRSTEDEERERLREMPSFKILNRAGVVKPGAVVLAEVLDREESERLPALVVQRFGLGRTGALLVGDLWRWGLSRDRDGVRDLERSWRQTARWLVSDVPRRIEVEALPHPEEVESTRIRVRVRDELFAPIEAASVKLRVTGPRGLEKELTAESSLREPGVFEATSLSREPGPYRVSAQVTLNETQLEAREAGWSSQTDEEEFRRLVPDRELLEGLARETGGEVVEGDRLEEFVADLATRDLPATEPWVSPMWHQWWVLAFLILCLAGEWGLRRTRGLP